MSPRRLCTAENAQAGWTSIANLPSNCPREERLTARRRSRRRPLTDFANRSPLHAFGVWLFRSALIALIALAVWLLIANWAVATLIDGLRP